ncbi:MAG: CvpA family protein [Ignavibacteria bacterium]
MNTLDIIILVLVMIPAFLGLKNGLLRSIFSLLGIITGLILATRFNDKISSLFSFLNIEPKLLGVISFIVIILFCYFVFIYIAGKISRLNAVTKTVDRLLGIVLGILKGLIIASLFLILTTNTFNLFDKTTIGSSKFYPAIINIAPSVYNYVKQFFPNAKDFYEELNLSVLRI